MYLDALFVINFFGGKTLENTYCFFSLNVDLLTEFLDPSYLGVHPNSYCPYFVQSL